MERGKGVEIQRGRGLGRRGKVILHVQVGHVFESRCSQVYYVVEQQQICLRSSSPQGMWLANIALISTPHPNEGVTKRLKSHCLAALAVEDHKMVPYD